MLQRLHRGLAPSSVWALATTVLEALALTSIALWNGYPVLFYDTVAYLPGWWQDGQKAVAYQGLPLLLEPLFHSLWPVVAVQALLTLYALRVTWRTLGLESGSGWRLGRIAFLCLGTALPWEVGYLMPDLFTGLGVLAAGLLIVDDALPRRDRWGLSALLTTSAATHNSNGGLLVLMLAAAVVPLLRTARTGLLRRLAAPSVALLVAFAVAAGLNLRVTGKAAVSFGTWALLTNRLAEDGLLQPFLAKHCARTAYPLCPYLESLSTERGLFLFGTPQEQQNPTPTGKSLLGKLGGWIDSGPSLRPMVIDAVLSDVWGNVRAGAKQSFLQLQSFDLETFVFSFPARHFVTETVSKRFPWDAADLAGSRQQQGTLASPNLAQAHRDLVFVALGLLLAFLVTGGRGPLRALAAWCLLAVLVNAIVCGLFSHAEPRYGARVIWLVPLMGWSALEAIVRARSPRLQGGPRARSWPAAVALAGAASLATAAAVAHVQARAVAAVREHPESWVDASQNVALPGHYLRIAGGVAPTRNDRTEPLLFSGQSAGGALTVTARRLGSAPAWLFFKVVPPGWAQLPLDGRDTLVLAIRTSPALDLELALIGPGDIVSSKLQVARFAGPAGPKGWRTVRIPLEAWPDLPAQAGGIVFNSGLADVPDGAQLEVQLDELGFTRVAR